MVKALVVGSGGGLGRALMAQLPAAGFETVALSHGELDVSRRNDVMAGIREAQPEVIFDVAGVSDVDVCEIDKWRAYLTNRDGAKHLALAAAETNALLVYPSSDLIFDGAKGSPYREEDSPNPLSIYGDTKLAAELAVMSHAPRHLIVRTGWLYGPGGKSYLSEFMEKRETDEVIFGLDDQKSQPTPYGDFVDALIALVHQNQSGVWHAACSGDPTPFEVGRTLFEMLGLDPGVIRPIRRSAGGMCALRPRYSVLDCSKLAHAGIAMRPWKAALTAFLSSHAPK